MLLNRIKNKLLRSFNKKGSTLNFSKENWEKVAQDGEFRFHKKNKWRQTDEFYRHTSDLFNYFGFSPKSYEGKTVVDLGAGSKLRTKYFEGAKLVVIEPLADRFLDEIKWCDLKEAEEVYSVGAEELVEELAGRVDLVTSINVLDHCYDFEKIVINIHTYLRGGGLAFLSFDSHDTTDEMHPLVLNQDICDDIFKRCGFVIEKATKGFGDKKSSLGSGGKDTYGHGAYCLNYWLRKA